MNNPMNVRYTDSLQDVVDFLSYLKAASWNFPSLYSMEYFDWKIIKNPFGDSVCYLRFIDEIPVAHVSITSKPLNAALGIGAFCAELGDTHTHPSYYKQGHFGAIGTVAIDEYQRKHKDALIFGIPNQNAVHGWQSRCNCELLSYLCLEERSTKIVLRKKLSQSLGCIDINDGRVKDFVNHIWNGTYKQNTSLYIKDSNWLEWRYQKSSEKYSFYYSQSDDDTINAYMIVKTTKKYFISHYQICDLVGLDVDLEIKIFDRFIKNHASCLSMVTIWSSVGTELNGYLMNEGFRFNRTINFVLYRNKAHEKFVSLRKKPTISMGDTDNV